MITPQELADLKTEYLQLITHYVSQNGGLAPSLSIFAEHKQESEKKHAILYLPIPSRYMADDDSKEEFVKTIIPNVGKSIKNQFTPKAVLWAAEAWVREMPKGVPIPDNYKDIPIDREILMVTFETETHSELLAYNIARKGKQINKHGDLIDKIELTLDETLSEATAPTGRFTGLLKKLQKLTD